jgi:ferric-dicitrate binding protein FerR (iron transport regulator)
VITKENIDELIGKYLAGEASPVEAMLLEDWKEESVANLHYFEDCRKIFEGQETRQGVVNVEAAWAKVAEASGIEGKVVPLQHKRRYWTIAAAILVLLGVGTAIRFYFFTEALPEILRVETGNQISTLTMKDESVIRLAAHSNISYSKDFGKTNRKIRLKGEAYFEVKHSEELPFIVDAGNVYIKDIGTKFDIRMSKDTDTVYVKVDEGVVLLFDSTGSELLIKATEKAVYVKSTKKITKITEPQEVKLPVLHFTNARLADIALELEKKYELTVEIDNKVLYDCRITTQFNGEPIETVLDIITGTLGLSYEKTPSGYLIKGTQCNN